jgi:hypothetical protein
MTGGHGVVGRGTHRTVVGSTRDGGCSYASGARRGCRIWVWVRVDRSAMCYASIGRAPARVASGARRGCGMGCGCVSIARSCAIRRSARCQRGSLGARRSFALRLKLSWPTPPSHLMSNSPSPPPDAAVVLPGVRQHSTPRRAACPRRLVIVRRRCRPSPSLWPTFVAVRFRTAST